MLLRKKVSSWLQNCNCSGSVPSVGKKEQLSDRKKRKDGMLLCAAVLSSVLLLCAGAEVLLHCPHRSLRTLRVVPFPTFSLNIAGERKQRTLLWEDSWTCGV